MTKRSAFNPRLSGLHNRGIVCSLILRNPGLSRSEIADQIGLSRAALSNILSGLINEGIVCESKRAGEDGRAGPKSLSLAVNPDHGRVIAVNIGHFTVAAGVYRTDGSVILTRTEPHRTAYPFDSSTNRIVGDIIAETLADSRTEGGQILGIGLGAPGYFSGSQSGSGSMEHPRYNWHALGIVGYIENRFMVPVVAGNCTDFAAIAEGYCGKGISSDRYILYSIGLGVGSSLVENDRIITGAFGISGEIGHTTINIDGPRCYCGNCGCLETYGSLGNLLKHDGELFEWNPNIDYRETVDGVKAVLSAAGDGESQAAAALDRVSRFISAGAVTLINLFAPDMVILAPNELDGIDIGPITERVRAYVRESVFSSLSTAAKIEQTSNPEGLELRGAFVEVMKRVFLR